MRTIETSIESSTQSHLPDLSSVVVIGGGIMGCSVAYHLAKLGIKPVVLLERHQITSGTTWHSAAQVRQLRSSQNLTQLIRYSVELYSQLEQETDQATGWYQTGSISIATNTDRLIHIRRQADLARLFGIEVHEITAAQVADYWPLAHTDDIQGAIYSPHDGRVNPSDLCAALIKGFKRYGGQVCEQTSVTGFGHNGRRITQVETNQGAIKCEQVALTSGLWSHDIGALIGANVPLHACEHFYLLTKPIAGIESHLPTLSDHDSHLYIRDDVGGLLVGCFEPHAKPIATDELPADFAFGLLNEDWSHFEPMLMNAIQRIPALETAESRMLLNGPESFTPDGNFMLGPTAEFDNLFLGCGMNSVGVASGGGAGKALAEWIAQGAAPMDLHSVDPRRFHRTENALKHLRERVPEVLGKHYEIAYPGREWQSGRDVRLGPLYEQHQQDNAYFGQRYGWERPLFFNCQQQPTLSFDRPEWFTQVAKEVKAAHQAVALFDQSTLGKIQVSGADAERFLQWVCANDMSRAPGSVIYTAMLNERGTFESDFTAVRRAADDYLLYVNSNAVARDLAWLLNSIHDEQVTLQDRSEDYAVIGLMGPRCIEVLQSACDGINPLQGLGFFQHREVELAGIPVQTARLSYVGEPGWELTVRTEQAATLYDCLCSAGQAYGIQPAGAYAQTAMRIEKRFLAFGHDMSSDETPLEADLGFTTKLNTDIDFNGRAALLKQRAGIKKRLYSLVLDDPGAVLVGAEPILLAGEMLGQVTSTAFGYRVGRTVALGYLPTQQKSTFAVEIACAGQLYSAQASLHAAFDPKNTRLKLLD